HASYPVPGDNHREGAAQFFVPDYTADGGPVWRTWERLERLRTEDPAEMQPWLRYGGFWGEPGSMPFGLNRGPRGPMFQESWHGDRETEDEVLLKGWMLFREDNGGNGDVVGRTTDAPGQVIRIPHRSDWTNDEAQTLQLYGVRGGTVITVYNDTDGDTDEGHSRITVKNDIDGMVLVGTFEADYEDDCFKVEVLHDGEVDGKVSRVTVQRTDDTWLPSYAGGGGGGTSGDPDRPPVHQNGLPETDPEAGTTTDGIIPEAEMATA
ncbi:MAG TPA: hypothetical protein VM759_03440, partial [Longimicrobium sp.]|nr:hypothetical protein [Longimicrobium sp.]